MTPDFWLGFGLGMGICSVVNIILLRRIDNALSRARVALKETKK
jgi:hypothetical protein